MRAKDFYSKIYNVISSLPQVVKTPKCSQLLIYLNQIMDDHINEIFKMTSITILFEGFYRAISNEDFLKTLLNSIRLERWGNHFGTPSINFLLTYNVQIESTRGLFEQSLDMSLEPIKPWIVYSAPNFSTDELNNIIVDDKAYKRIQDPLEKEETGRLLKTYNPIGGFTTTPCDPISKKFIDYVSDVVQRNGAVLEIGAAFGAASLEALAKGANVYCNDIDVKNLAVVKNRSNNSVETKTSITGDTAKLNLIPGSFPEELSGLPKNYFDAILICRVLHFFKGEMIEKSLKQLSDNLKSGGRLFVVCETPFLKNWQRFIPEFEERKSTGQMWPGEISNPIDYESSGRASSLPKFVHWITKEVLERCLKNTSLQIEDLAYIDRKGQFPDELLLDGKESVGAVAFKL